MSSEKSELEEWAKEGCQSKAEIYHRGRIEGALHLLEVAEEYCANSEKVFGGPGNSPFTAGMWDLIEHLRIHCGKGGE